MARRSKLRFSNFTLLIAAVLSLLFTRSTDALAQDARVASDRGADPRGSDRVPAEPQGELAAHGGTILGLGPGYYGPVGIAGIAAIWIGGAKGT